MTDMTLLCVAIFATGTVFGAFATAVGVVISCKMQTRQDDIAEGGLLSDIQELAGSPKAWLKTRKKQARQDEGPILTDPYFEAHHGTKP